MAEQRGRFLYELAPDLFPEGFVTDKEMAVWELHYEAKKSG